MSIEIEEWEIWHTYTTYLDATNLDLSQTAGRLVASGVAECAMLSDGRTFWNSNGTVASGSTQISIDAPSGRSTFQLRLDDGCQRPEGFALEAWGQASYFLIGEQKVLGADTPPPPYARAYLGKCRLTSGSSDNASHLNLYPVLIIYESGVLLLEFRMIGPDHLTPFKTFITGSVNLFRYRFDLVEVSPGLVSFATRAYYQSAHKWNFLRRLQLIWLQAGHDLAIRQRTNRETDKHFSFDLAPLSSADADDLKSIALTIFHTTAFLTGHPRLGLAFLFRGHVPAPVLGEFWSGRPHIHLVRFRDQRKTAAENEANHGADFARILCRVPALDDVRARQALPKDARMFQDYNAYVTSATSLWVWSGEGLSEQAANMDPNRGNLIYERQVVVELLEYGYMLHRSLYHRLQDFGTTSEVVAIRKQLLQLQRHMYEASHAGEIRDLLENGWKELGLPRLVAEIDAGLRLRESETKTTEALRTTRVGWALTVIFGLVAVPALADQVILPLWKLTSFPQFADASLTKLVSDGVAIVVVLFCLLTTLWLIPHPSQNSK